MVDVARRRNSSLDNVETATIDATAIDRADASFDVVACRMGLMFAPDPSLAFAEIHRVLRHGGRVGVLTWGAIEHNPWMTCVGMAAMMNGLGAGGLPTAPGGIFSLSDPATLEQLARGAGFIDVHVDVVPVTFRARTIDDHVDRVSSLAGPLAVVLANASPDQRHAFRRTAHELAAPHLTPDGLAIPGKCSWPLHVDDEPLTSRADCRTASTRRIRDRVVRSPTVPGRRAVPADGDPQRHRRR
jgi:SAM-dependent methyltransferase